MHVYAQVSALAADIVCPPSGVSPLPRAQLDGPSVDRLLRAAAAGCSSEQLPAVLDALRAAEDARLPAGVDEGVGAGVHV